MAYERFKVLHEITACIYNKRDEKPVMKWSFLSKLEEDLSSFSKHMKSCGIEERAKELGIKRYKLKVNYKRLTPETDFSRGRIFAVDTEEQYQIALSLLQDKHELICKCEPVNSSPHRPSTPLRTFATFNPSPS